MHSIFGAGVILASAILLACGDPVGPKPQPESELARRPAPGPITVPDSIGIPPSIPPIYEEAPAGIEGPQ
jgi:hypothetical protein